MGKSSKLAGNVYTGLDAGRLAQKYVNERTALNQQGKMSLMEFGIPKINEYMNPFMGGDLICTLGRPGQGKSLLTNWLFDNQLKRLSETRPANEVGIYITSEVSVERAALYWMSRIADVSMRRAIRGELDKIEIGKLGLAAVKLSTYPLFIIGHSLERSENNKRGRPDLTVNNINNAIDYIINTYKDPETDRYIDPQIIILDYLQRLSIPRELHGNRAEAMLQAVDWAKNTAIWTGSPLFLNVQASRDVDQRQIKIPEKSDAQWTSNVEQSADLLLGVWMPYMTNDMTIPAIGGAPALRSTPNLLMLAVLKQKDGPAGSVFPLYVEPEKLRIMEYGLH